MKYKVMLVDDMKFIRDDIKRRLSLSEDINYQIIAEIEDGAKAITSYFELKPDLVLLDLILPVASGIDVSKEILSRDPKAKICLVAAMGHEPYIQQALKLGVKDFIIKPFETEVLLQNLKSIILSS